MEDEQLASEQTMGQRRNPRAYGTEAFFKNKNSPFLCCPQAVWRQGLDAFKLQLHSSPTATVKEGIAAGNVIDMSTTTQEVLKTVLTCGSLVCGIQEASQSFR